ncbi:MAG: hypothetical protein IAE79_21135 [Anaerolinea sp.]|nr:hypothetical protein [Anaerolinea sp.]
MSTPPEFSNWQEAWEWYASQTAADLATQSVDGLLRLIQTRQYDPYYQIWYTLSEKATLAQCAPTLLNVLRRESGDHLMLVRYHCAAVLFHLLGYPDDPIPPLRARAQWDQNGEEARQTAVAELAALIETHLRQRPAA